MEDLKTEMSVESEVCLTVYPGYCGWGIFLDYFLFEGLLSYLKEDLSSLLLKEYKPDTVWGNQKSSMSGGLNCQCKISTY